VGEKLEYYTRREDFSYPKNNRLGKKGKKEKRSSKEGKSGEAISCNGEKKEEAFATSEMVQAKTSLRSALHAEETIRM